MMMFICLVKFDEVPKAEKSEMKLENERAETKLEQNGTNDKQITIYDAIAICHFLYSFYMYLFTALSTVSLLEHHFLLSTVSWWI